MKLVLRALRLGAAFGLAAATVEAWLSLIPVVLRRLGPGPEAILYVAILEIGLCMILGLVATPFLRLRGGTLLHILALVLAWVGLAKWVELDSALFARLQYVPPIAGALLLGIGLWIARWRPAVSLALGGLLLAGGISAPAVYLDWTTPPPPLRVVSAPAPARAPDVVLVVLDTVREQNLSTYGYARPTSPTLDRLAQEGALFLDATSPSTWSLASHASLFTGRYPSGHGAHMESLVLDDRYPTLAGVLASRGYDTYCFTANAWISDALGLTRGFGWQDTSWKSGELTRSFAFIHRLLAHFGVEPRDKGGGVVAEHFAAWIRERPEGERPTFTFLNFIEAHFPYHQLPDAYLGRFTNRPRAELRRLSMELLAAQFGGALSDPQSYRGPAVDMYDGGVLYSDHLLAQVVEGLRARGTLDKTVLIVLGDHGELLGEHAGFFGHGPSLYEQIVRVPLLVRYPPAVPAGVRIERPVSTVGVFATILDLIGIEAPPTLQVGSLVPVIGGLPGGGPVLSERHKADDMMVDIDVPLLDPLMNPNERYRAYRDGRWKLIETSEGNLFLYDVEGDPGESHDLAAERPAEVQRLAAKLAQVREELGLPAIDATTETAAAPELDPETQSRLRELGYIQ